MKRLLKAPIALAVYRLENITSSQLAHGMHVLDKGTLITLLDDTPVVLYYRVTAHLALPIEHRAMPPLSYILVADISQELCTMVESWREHYELGRSTRKRGARSASFIAERFQKTISMEVQERAKVYLRLVA
jgi:hypothetical protein